eukprot:4403139-Lingulodinium_polyedra.AAC.1
MTQREQLEQDRDMLQRNMYMLQKICATRLKELQKTQKDFTASGEKIVEIKHLVAEEKLEIDAGKRRK